MFQLNVSVVCFIPNKKARFPHAERFFYIGALFYSKPPNPQGSGVPQAGAIDQSSRLSGHYCLIICILYVYVCLYILYMLYYIVLLYVHQMSSTDNVAISEGQSFLFIGAYKRYGI